MSTDRNTVLSAQFLTPRLEVAGRPLRRFSAGVLITAQVLGIKILIGGEGEISPQEKNMELLEVLYLLTVDPDTLKVAVAGGREKFRSNFVMPFSFEIPVEELGKVAEALALLGGQAAAASVEVVPKPSTSNPDGPTPPPNS